MGRQAYLAKIAFGRSAFEPTQSATESPEYLQLDASQSELPRAYQEAGPNNHIQLYDERGNPINPRSHEYGKKLRDAQNDVLASVGVVERRRSPSDGLPGSYEEHLDLLEAEDTVGNAVALTTTLTENLCTWWIGTVRERLLTFRYPDAATLTQIVTSERNSSGAALVYTGFAPRLFSTLSMQAIVYSTLVYQPIDRFLYATGASLRTRYFLRRSKNVLRPILRIALDVLFCPFSYFASLQRLGLIPARPLLPSFKSLTQFSSLSLLLPLSPRDSGPTSTIGCIKVALVSPVVLICAEQAFERWIYSCTYEAVESSIIRPDNADMQSRDTIDKDRTIAFLGLRRQSMPLVRNTINKFLTLLGWGVPLMTGAEQNPSTSFAQLVAPTGGPSLDIGGARVSNLTPLEISNSHGQNHATATDIEDPSFRPATPPTPIASTHDQGENDPRIRITSREGIVEMEVRLPPRVLSTEVEVTESPISSPNHRDDALQDNTNPLSSRSYHRITNLSSEPAQMISAIVKAQLIGVVILPMKLIVLQRIATHYLASHEGHGVNVQSMVPLPNLRDLTWRSLGILMSRVALCNAVEFAIDLSLWSLQYKTITFVGQSVFGWGML